MNDLLSIHWRKFLARFEEITTLPLHKWEIIHFLAYICFRYKEHYDRDFAMTYSGQPSKCTEIVLIRKMCAMLGTINPEIVKAYIDWVFDAKIIPQDKQIKTLAFFMTPGLGNEFHFVRNKKTKIDKSTELPSNYQKIVSTLDLPINTYGDLAFAKMVLDREGDKISESKLPYFQLFQQLFSLGLDTQILENLI